MSDLVFEVENLEKVIKEVTEKDIIMSYILQNTSIEELADELQNRLNGSKASKDLKSIKNSIIINELTRRLASMSIIVTTAAMLDEMGQNINTSYSILDGYSHISSSMENV